MIPPVSAPILKEQVDAVLRMKDRFGRVGHSAHNIGTTTSRRLYGYNL